MRLRPYLRPGLVLTGFAASGMEDVFRRLGSRLAEQGVVASQDEIAQALMTRELMHSTVLGEGIALPHATVPGLEEPFLMVALAAEPIEFGNEHLGPVTVFFVLLSPPGRESDHIKLMARLCRLSRHPEFIEELVASSDDDEALDVILRVDGQHV